ncbi:hypothetical protein HDU99_000363, partial [Rhizoclosmatium hyalinum]
MVKATNARKNLTEFENVSLPTGNLVNPVGGGGMNRTNMLLGFDPQSFKVEQKPLGSERIMAAVIKIPEMRGDEDFKLLEILVGALPGFAAYPLAVRSGLARVIGYSRFGPGRTIIKEGHVANNYYYILSGTLDVYKFIEGKQFCLKQMQPGMVFGELALLLDDSHRSATVISNSNVELLWLNRDDFETVLKRETFQEYQTRKGFISKHPFFAQLGQEAIENLALTAETVEVKPDKVILNEGDVPNCIYLL